MPFQTQTPPEESSVTPQADQTETLQEETLPVPAEPSVPETGSKSKAVSEFAPVVPQNFRVSEGGLREVVITWSRPYDRPYRYIIEKSMNPEGPFIEMDRISPSKKTFTDKGSKQFPLEDNRSYFYRMISISKDGIMSEPTPVKESKTAPPPEAPTNLSVKANKPRGVFLTWDFSPSDWVVSHIIQRKQANKPDNFMDIGTVKELAYFQDGGTTDSILVDSTEYIYRIVAVNKVGSIGTPSDPVIVKTLPPPAKVSGIVAKEDEIRCVPLSWEVHSDPNVVKYILYRMDSQEGTFKEIAVIKGRENTSYLDGKKNPGNLLDQHTYYYSVYAENYVGAVSTDADIVSATTRSLPPSVESFCAAPPQSRQVMLAWEASKDDKVNGYQIWRSDGKIPFVQIDTVKGREQTAYVDKGTGRFPDKGLGKL
ncbi:MAG: hypothetical protein JW774_06940, partial [Candidatus Aureabacteria bacterium]|nr:hypothetical protein [Candidatus Auribacterota bacterium]